VLLGAISSTNVTVLVAFGGGIVSILSPCVLPLVPGYLSLVTGLSVTELREGERKHLWRIAGMTGLFTLGFGAVFTILGLAATNLGRAAFENQEMLTRISGVVIIVMAAYLAGSQLLRAPRLYPEARFHVTDRFGMLTAPIAGAAFAFGWSPCLGPVIAAVFGVAATNEGVPLYGRAASGNRSDSNELRYLMRRVAERVPDPKKTCIVGDSKLFSGETILLARELGFDYVTLMPKTTNARDEAIRLFHAADRRGEVKVLLEKEGRGGDRETWRGCSAPVVYDHKDEVTKEVTRMLLRTVVVESSGLARQKKVTLEKERARERRVLEKELAAESAKSYHCRADAEETVKATFAAELANGQLVWKPLNVDEAQNEHFVQDYQLFTRSLVLVDGTNPKRFKNLDKVWQLVRDKPVFQKYVQDEVRAFQKS